MSFAGDHFSQQASDYSLYRPHYPQALFEYLGSLTAQHDLAWDCATGNGQAAVALAFFYNRVEATDASENQVSQAAAHERVHYQVCEATSTPFADNHFDLITVAQALHWFELDAFYKEVARVSKPGGIFAAWCYGLFSINTEVDARIKHFYTDTVGPFWPEERKYIEDGYATLAFPFERIQSPGFAMSVTWDLHQLLGYLGTWSATQYYREQRQHDPLPDLYEQLKPHWPDETVAKEIRWPLHLKVGQIPV